MYFKVNFHCHVSLLEGTSTGIDPPSNHVDPTLQEQRAWFLQFATGTSRVPVEGFKARNPPDPWVPGIFYLHE